MEDIVAYQRDWRNDLLLDRPWYWSNLFIVWIGYTLST